MFGIDGQYLIDISVGGITDFIQSVEFESFEITELAGNTLPQFKLVFSSFNQDLQQFLNEGNVLTASFGQDRNSLQSISLIICSCNAPWEATGKRKYTIEGLQYLMEYVGINKMRHSLPTSAIELMTTVASKYFLIDAGPTRSNDQQVWIQNSLTDRNFINHLWLHTDLGTSFPMIGISSLQNRFIIRDAVQLFQQDPAWIFTPNPSASNEVHYEANFNFRNSSSVFNSIAGYNRPDVSINREQGTDDSNTPNPKPGLSTAANFNRQADITPRVGSIKPLTDNMHPNYHNSYYFNTQSLLLFSSFRGDLNFRGFYLPMKVLDLVLFKDIDSSGVSDGYSSGLYIISRISRVFNAQQHGTFLTITRESPGGMKGSFQ